MGKVLFDLEKSEKLSSLGVFTPKCCYDNVYNNLNILAKDEFKNFEIKVMFAYVSVSELKNIYTRHACYYIDGKAVDPTVYNIYKEKAEDYDIHYLPIMIMSITEYLTLLGREYRTDLFKTLESIEHIKQKKYSENGVIFIG